MEGMVKLNTDAAFHQDTGESWAGAVTRDSNGRVFNLVCRRMGSCASIQEAETYAIAGLVFRS